MQSETRDVLSAGPADEVARGPRRWVTALVWAAVAAVVVALALGLAVVPRALPAGTCSPCRS